MKKSFVPFLFRLLFLCIGGLLILGQFGRFELAGGRALYMHDIFLVTYGVLFVLIYHSMLVKLFTPSITAKVLALINVWIIFTSILNFHAHTQALVTSLLYLCRFDAIVLFGYAVATQISLHVYTRKEIFQWLSAVVTGIAVLGFVQYFLFPDTRALKLLGWDDHYYRLISTIFDPGFTGILLVLGSFLVLQKLLSSKSWKMGSLYVFLCAAVLLTYSRASYLALAAGLLYLVVRLKNIKIIGIMGLFALGIVLLPRPGGEGVKLERTASAVARIESVQSAVSDVNVQTLLIGKGWYWKKESSPTSQYDGIEVPNHSSAPENAYVFLATSLGILGLLLFGVFAYILIAGTGWEQTVVAVWIALGVHALFTNTFFQPFVLIWLVIFMAYSAPLHLAQSRQQRR